MTEAKNGQSEEIVVEGDLAAGGDTVRIANEVIGVIAGLAAGEVAGLAGMSGGLVGGIAERLGRKDLAKGIKVSLEGDNVTLDVYVIVDYGIKIQEVAQGLKDKVRSTVEDMAGLKVKTVNVHVQGINVPKENEEQE